MENGLMTKAGYSSLVDKLNYYKTTLRAEAREEVNKSLDGNLSENSQFHLARAQQSQIESRISELERIVSNVKIVDISNSNYSGVVAFGAKVRLVNIDSDEEKTFRIVGEYEADPKNGMISYTSPLGRAALGLEEGEEFSIQTPRGEACWQIISISN